MHASRLKVPEKNQREDFSAKHFCWQNGNPDAMPNWEDGSTGLFEKLAAKCIAVDYLCLNPLIRPFAIKISIWQLSRCQYSFAIVLFRHSGGF